eukprot:scaffold200009_cov36-Tisochrysis_lutea.AAC.2
MCLVANDDIFIDLLRRSVLESSPACVRAFSRAPTHHLANCRALVWRISAVAPCESFAANGCETKVGRAYTEGSAWGIQLSMAGTSLAPLRSHPGCPRSRPKPLCHARRTNGLTAQPLGGPCRTGSGPRGFRRATGIAGQTHCWSATGRTDSGRSTCARRRGA